MSLIKWTPRTRFPTPFDDFDRLLDRFFTGRWDSSISPSVDWIPAFDVIEKEKEYVVRIEAPSMEKADFTIRVNDGVLTVSGEKKVEESNNGLHYTHRESSYGRFSRSFRLPDDAVGKKIKANYKNGVLTITMPRTKPIDSKAIEVEIS